VGPHRPSRGCASRSSRRRTRAGRGSCRSSGSGTGCGTGSPFGRVPPEADRCEPQARCLSQSSAWCSPDPPSPPRRRRHRCPSRRYAASEPGAFEYPAELEVDVREARGESIGVAPAPLTDPVEGIYRATVTLPEATRYVLQVGGGDLVFERGVETIAALPEPIVPDAGPGLDPRLLAVAGLGAIVLIGLGLVALREAG
jgi:hypothetical protein